MYVKETIVLLEQRETALRLKVWAAYLLQVQSCGNHSPLVHGICLWTDVRPLLFLFPQSLISNPISPPPPWAPMNVLKYMCMCFIKYAVLFSVCIFICLNCIMAYRSFCFSFCVHYYLKKSLHVSVYISISLSASDCCIVCQGIYLPLIQSFSDASSYSYK